MNATKEARIIASMRNQVAEVRLMGIGTPARWVERYDGAVAQGVTFPADLANIREYFANGGR